MEPNKTITIDADLWHNTLAQLKTLRQQNMMLKAAIKAIQLKSSSSLKNRHSMTQSNLLSNKAIDQQNKNEKIQFKSEMNEWLKKINQSHSLKFQNSPKKATKLHKIQEDKQEYNDPRSAQSIEIQTSGSNATKNDKQLEHSQDKQGQKKQQNGKSQHKQKLSLSNQNIDRAVEELKQLKNINKSIMMSKKRSSSQIPKEVPKQLRFIESICLFGPNQKQIAEQIANRKMAVPSSLIFTSSSEQSRQSFQVYGQYFYPQGQATVRTIREQQIATKTNQIIFRKNTKKQDCCIYVFRGDQNNHQLQKQENHLLSKINPGKWLIAFFVQFDDYEVVNVEQFIEDIEQKINKSVELSRREQNKNQISYDTERVTVNKRKSGQHYVRSKYTLCIFTYFPLINVMEQLLSSILDQVKIKRFSKYSDSNKTEDVSIKFLANQLKEVSDQIKSQVQKISPCLGGQVKISFGSITVSLQMTQNKLDDLLYTGWGYDIIKIFEKDIIYDLFTNLMTEQSICFVSQNMHLLTYIIFFFVCILPFPFTYPHPCISKVFNFQLLQSPFVVTAGINQSTKWLQQNIGLYPKKIFVDLNDECKIKGKKKLKSIKSQKLRKVFNILYKRLDISPIPQIFKKKQTIIKSATRQQNETVISFIRSLQNFFSEQIFNHLPNPAIIAFLRDKIDEKNETSKIFNILKQIEKYLKQSRKQKEKDQFIDLLIQQQIFYVHMGIRYSLD